MTSNPHLTDERPHARLVAPLRHTAVLILILAAIAVGGVRFQSRATSTGAVATQHTGNATLYVSLILAEWALVYFVWNGLRSGGMQLRELIGGRWSSGKAVLLDVAFAVGLWIVLEGVGKLSDLLRGPDRARAIDALLPQGGLETLLWIALSISAGFSEEVVYRGYLQKQILALSGSAAVAVLAQALLFGLSHAYQGTRQVIIITVYGAAFGVLALWRGQLRSNIVAHAWTDIFSGLLAR